MSKSIDHPKNAKLVIAFAASAPHVGKTTTANILKDMFAKEGVHVEVFTIASLIRKSLATVADLLEIDSSRFFENYDQKDCTIAFGNEEVPFKTRDLLCDFSILMQKFYGKNVWGQSAVNVINKYDADIVFIDDLRRPDELDVLRQTFGNKLITVYLEKEDVNPINKTQVLSDSAQQFESKLSKDDLDYSFTFTPNWSNTSELLVLIKSFT